MAKALVLSLLVLFLSSPTVFGVDHTVGDSGGWALGNDYSTWVSGKTFTVGDNLVFKYDSTHQVDEVDESGYKGCNSSNAIKNYQDGDSKVPLTKAGKVYFICPTPGHCAGGMKLEVNVVAASTTPSGGSPSPTTPSGGSPPPTSPSGGSPSPTTPSSGSPPPTTPSDSPSNSSPSTPSESGTPQAAPSPKSNGAVSVSSGISSLMGSLFVAAIVLGFMC